MKFKVGDLVHLLCGGPAMVVARIHEEDGISAYDVETFWFNDTGEMNRACMPSKVLTTLHVVKKEK